MMIDSLSNSIKQVLSMLWCPTPGASEYNSFRTIVEKRNSMSTSNEWIRSGVPFEDAQQILEIIASENGFDHPWFYPSDKLLNVVCDEAYEFASSETLDALAKHYPINESIVEQLYSVRTVGDFVRLVLMRNAGTGN